jgi:hypothetical protein
MRDELERFGLEDYISIPVSLVLVILVGYVAIGALLLRVWEDWDFFTAFYFSFITMTTVSAAACVKSENVCGQVGFGDIVPEKQAYFLLDLLYIIIGLAITTMCIDLVGIQYIRKIHYFGRAIKGVCARVRAHTHVQQTRATHLSMSADGWCTSAI